MFDMTDQAIIAFGRKVIHMLPYGSLSILGYPVGEIAWIIAIVATLGEVYIILYKKKVVR